MTRREVSATAGDLADWMDEKKLVFAPASFQQVITEIAQMAKAHAKD